MLKQMINQKQLYIVCCFFILSSVLGILFPQDWAGWLVCGISFYVILLIPEIKTDKKLFVICLLVLLAHHVVSVMNAHFIPVYGASLDAVSFHKKALEVAKTSIFLKGIGAPFFTNLLGIAYKLNPSQFFGQELTILAFTFFLVFLTKLMDLLELKRGKVLVIAILGFMPHIFLWTSVILREAYQILFLCAGIYFGLLYKIHQKKFFYLIMSVLALTMFGLLHRALIFYAPFLFLLMMIWPFSKKKRTFTYWLTYLLIAAGLCALFLIFLLHTDARIIVSDMVRKMIMTFSQYRESTLVEYSGYSTYFVPINPTNTIGLIYSIFNVWLYYLFSCVVTQVSFWFIVYVFLNVLLRILLIFFIIGSFFKKQFVKFHRTYLFLFIVYLSLTLLWAIGVANYGTALRHQITTEWIIIMLGIPFILNFLKILAMKVN
ncbi:MAG: hypothetical protein JW855_01875 [Gammaproteobacteria bacterium]|nr:hypothetical protein [Gammaproteobacteria bacterium]